MTKDAGVARGAARAEGAIDEMSHRACSDRGRGQGDSLTFLNLSSEADSDSNL